MTKQKILHGLTVKKSCGSVGAGASNLPTSWPPARQTKASGFFVSIPSISLCWESANRKAQALLVECSSSQHQDGLVLSLIEKLQGTIMSKKLKFQKKYYSDKKEAHASIPALSFSPMSKISVLIGLMENTQEGVGIVLERIERQENTDKALRWMLLNIQGELAQLGEYAKKINEELFNYRLKQLQAGAKQE